MTRQEYNKELLMILTTLIETEPDLRFSQILQSYGFVKPQRAVKEPGEQTWQNEFYMEPDFVLKRVKGRLTE